MGMFDDIIVPKSYLRGLLSKKEEKILKVSKRYGGSVTGCEFQTKDLENTLSMYKVYKQKLYTNDKALWNCEPPDTEQKSESTSKNTLTKKVVGKKFTILAQSYFIIHLKMKNKMNGGLNLSLHLTTGG
jgi:hypothetical protein